MSCEKKTWSLSSKIRFGKWHPMIPPQAAWPGTAVKARRSPIPMFPVEYNIFSNAANSSETVVHHKRFHPLVHQILLIWNKNNTARKIWRILLERELPQTTYIKLVGIGFRIFPQICLVERQLPRQEWLYQPFAKTFFINWVGSGYLSLATKYRINNQAGKSANPKLK